MSELVAESDGTGPHAGMPMSVRGAMLAKAAGAVRASVTGVHPGDPHGLTATVKERFNADLLAFVRA